MPSKAVGNSAMDRHSARAAEFARAEKARAAAAKRASEAAMKAANIDTAGLDPEMRETLGQESARRVGASGVGVRTKNPFAGLFRKKPRAAADSSAVKLKK